MVVALAAPGAQRDDPAAHRLDALDGASQQSVLAGLAEQVLVALAGEFGEEVGVQHDRLGTVGVRVPG